MELSFPFTLLFWLVDFPRPIKFNQSGAPHSKFKNQKKTDAILSGYHSGRKMFHVRCSNEIDTSFVANLVQKSGINTVTGTHKKNKLWEELFRPTFLLRPSQAEAVVLLLFWYAFFIGYTPLFWKKWRKMDQGMERSKSVQIVQ